MPRGVWPLTLNPQPSTHLTLPNKLRAFRRSRALSQSAAARRLGVPLKTLQAWEQGVRSPRSLGLVQLLQLLKEL